MRLKGLFPLNLINNSKNKTMCEIIKRLFDQDSFFIQ